MMKKLIALVMIVVMSGCLFGSHKSRYIQNGITAGLGTVVITSPLWDPASGGNEGQGVGNSIGTGVAVVVGSLLLVLAGAGFTIAALDPSPDP